jgi:hypothetical protein
MRLSIRQKLVVFIVLPILLIVGVVGGITLSGLQRRLTEQAKYDTARLAAHLP